VNVEPILQGIAATAGVTVVFVFDSDGRVAGFKGQPLYDEALLTEVARGLLKAAESLELQNPEWDGATVQFADGRLLLRNLGAQGGRNHYLAVAGDAQVALPLFNVGLRVAVQKLKKALDGTGAATSALTASGSAARDTAPARSKPSLAPAVTASAQWREPAKSPASVSGPASASSSLTWSKASGASSSSLGVEVVDAAALSFLTRCSKELARDVGPVANLAVKEAVRRLCGAEPFGLQLARKLVEALGSTIEDEDDRARFRRAMEK
jgi:hypothetical protein